jgi:hypothetical protein
MATLLAEEIYNSSLLRQHTVNKKILCDVPSLVQTTALPFST